MTMRWLSAAKSMLPGNACKTSLADTKHIFIEKFMAHRILHPAKTTRGPLDACALRARRDYKLASLFEIEVNSGQYFAAK